MHERSRQGTLRGEPELGNQDLGGTEEAEGVCTCGHMEHGQLGWAMNFSWNRGTGTGNELRRDGGSYQSARCFRNFGCT